MINKKKIIFLTGTRADFGKLKSLIKITQKSDLFEIHIFATGMHLISKYGKTINEIYKSGFTNIFPFINHDEIEHMDRNLAKTIDGFSHYINEINPDLIVVHGDRVEALAGAIVGSLNNTLVAHIEGGEVSGTIDELIRHSITKLSHIHLVSNNEAQKRLIQMGEDKNSIFKIGSPDLDLMNAKNLPSLEFVKNYYDINFKNYSILMFHSVTTEINNLKDQVKILIKAIKESDKNYIVIFPNNDLGSDIILNEYKQFEKMKSFQIFPSLRFEYFLVLLKNCEFMLGNSSAGIREAPYYNVPAINVGNRQKGRAKSKKIINVDFDADAIIKAISQVHKLKNTLLDIDFGEGNSDRLFLDLLKNKKLWRVSHQKQFQDL